MSNKNGCLCTGECAIWSQTCAQKYPTVESGTVTVIYALLCLQVYQQFVILY